MSVLMTITYYLFNLLDFAIYLLHNLSAFKLAKRMKNGKVNGTCCFLSTAQELSTADTADPDPDPDPDPTN